MDIFCFILTTNYYQTFFKVTVPILYYSTQTTGLKLELKGGENQWPGGGELMFEISSKVQQIWYNSSSGV